MNTPPSEASPSEQTVRRLIERDPLLAPHAPALLRRVRQVEAMEQRLTEGRLDLAEFASGHEYFGLRFRDGCWVLREWAPNAQSIHLKGPFSAWRAEPEYALSRHGSEGVWEIQLAEKVLAHGDPYRIEVRWDGGGGDRVPAWVRRVVRDEETGSFNAQVWRPPAPYEWRHARPPPPAGPLLVYEAHVGMAQEEPKVGTYDEFRTRVLPRVRDAGYKVLQIMALAEHPYYASFGYQVSSYFACSSRFGTPEELESPRGRGARHGTAGVHGPRPFPRRPQRGRGHLAPGRHFDSVLPRGSARRAPRLALALLRLRQAPGAPLPTVQLPLLDGRVPVRRLPVRWGDEHALRGPRACAKLHELRRLFRPRGRRGRSHLLDARQQADRPALAGRRDHRRGRFRLSGSGAASCGRRCRLRLQVRDESRRQVPGDGQDEQSRCRRRHVEPGLVAEPAEPQDPAPALGPEQSDGRAIRLRRGVQEARPEGPEEGPPRADDRLAGLVAGRLRPLRRPLHPHGVAQRRHLPHRRRPRRRGIRHPAPGAPQQLARQREPRQGAPAALADQAEVRQEASPGPT